METNRVGKSLITARSSLAAFTTVNAKLERYSHSGQSLRLGKLPDPAKLSPGSNGEEIVENGDEKCPIVLYKSTRAQPNALQGPERFREQIMKQREFDIGSRTKF